MTSPSPLPHDPVAILALLEELHAAIRARVCETMRTSPDPAAPARESAGDTLYQIDVDVEPLIVAFFTERFAPRFPCTVIAEGVNDDQPLVLGDPEAPSRLRLILDPIDGTRGLMYDKRSAWVLTGVAPDLGDATMLADIQLALQTEIPTTKMNRADQLWARRGAGFEAVRVNLDTGDEQPLKLRPTRATGLEHGFAQISRFFGGGKDILAAIEEELLREVVGPVVKGRALVFEDQYISNAGQLYELIAGHDRFTADLRPLLEPALAARGEALGITSHPYDLCTVLIAQEAGVIVTGCNGEPFDAPMDTTSEVGFTAYANEALRKKIEPALTKVVDRTEPGSKRRRSSTT